MNPSEIPCGECYQQPVCQRAGNPIYTSILFDGREPDEPNPESCFLEVCSEGLLAAKVAFREAQRVGIPCLKLVSTEHKPYIRDRAPNGDVISGRSVAFQCEGWKDGDVVVFLEEMPYKTTNIFDLRPRRRKSDEQDA